MQPVWTNTNDYICADCGNELQYGKNFNLLFCKSCGSIFNEKKEKHSSLDYYDDSSKQCSFYLPFRIKEEDVCTEFNVWLNKVEMMPNGFKANVKLRNLRKVFVPHLLVSAECTVDVKGNSRELIEDVTSSKAYIPHAFEHSSLVSINNVPFVLNNQVERSLAEAAEPFYVTDRKPLDTKDSLLEDSEILEINKHPVTQDDHFGLRIRKGMERYCKKHYHAPNEEITISENASYCKDLVFESCYLPFYLAEYEFGGTVYNVIVNGQTGRIACDLPSCYEKEEKIKKARMITYLIITVAVPIIIFIIIRFCTNILFAIISLPVTFFGLRALLKKLVEYSPKGTHYPLPLNAAYYTNPNNEVWKGTLKIALPFVKEEKDALRNSFLDRLRFDFMSLFNRGYRSKHVYEEFYE